MTDHKYSRPNRSRRLLLAGVAVPISLISLASCSKSEPLTSASTTPTSTSTTQPATTPPEPAEPSTTTSTTTSVVPVATTSPPAPVTTPVPGAPPVPTNDEWTRIFNALNARQAAMYADPPNADVTAVCVAGSNCDRLFTTQMDDMVNKGWHTENNPPSEVVSIDKVVDVAAVSNGTIAPGTMYEVTWTMRSGDMSKAVIVDASGNLVYHLTEEDGAPPTATATNSMVWYPQDQEVPWRFID